MQDNEIFMNYIGDNYNQLKKRMKGYCFNKSIIFNEDVFQSTIIRCYDLITKNKTMKDNTPSGIENFFFMAFKTNIVRELEYAYIKNRDYNITGDALKDKYEEYKETETTQDEKVSRDMYLDFSTKYILNLIEQNFSPVDFHLFKIKLFYTCTYKRLKELTKIKDCKNRIIKINEWVKQNITKQEINKAFEEYCDNLY